LILRPRGYEWPVQAGGNPRPWRSAGFYRNRRADSAALGVGLGLPWRSFCIMPLV